MSKFTPGPWSVHPIKAQVDGVGESGIVPICALLWPTDERSEEETEANADLISAAPDMYEVLKRIEPIIEALEVLNLGKAEPGSLATQLRAALSKADGK